jgi:hypothetical protein
MSSVESPKEPPIVKRSSIGSLLSLHYPNIPRHSIVPEGFEGVVCDTIGYKQHLGECWSDSIQQIFMFADGFKETTQDYLYNTPFSTIERKVAEMVKMYNKEVRDDLQDTGTRYLQYMQERFINHYDSLHSKEPNFLASQQKCKENPFASRIEKPPLRSQKSFEASVLGARILKNKYDPTVSSNSSGLQSEISNQLYMFLFSFFGFNYNLVTINIALKNKYPFLIHKTTASLLNNEASIKAEEEKLTKESNTNNESIEYNMSNLLELDSLIKKEEELAKESDTNNESNTKSKNESVENNDASNTLTFLKKSRNFDIKLLNILTREHQNISADIQDKIKGKNIKAIHISGFYKDSETGHACAFLKCADKFFYYDDNFGLMPIDIPNFEYLIEAKTTIDGIKDVFINGILIIPTLNKYHLFILESPQSLPYFKTKDGRWKQLSRPLSDPKFYIYIFFTNYHCITESKSAGGSSFKRARGRKTRKGKNKW